MVQYYNALRLAKTVSWIFWTSFIMKGFYWSADCCMTVYICGFYSQNLNIHNIIRLLILLLKNNCTCARIIILHRFWCWIWENACDKKIVMVFFFFYWFGFWFKFAYFPNLQVIFMCTILLIRTIKYPLNLSSTSHCVHTSVYVCE